MALTCLNSSDGFPYPYSKTKISYPCLQGHYETHASLSDLISHHSAIFYSQYFLCFIERPILASGYSNLPWLLPGSAAPQIFGCLALISVTVLSSEMASLDYFYTVAFPCWLQSSLILHHLPLLSFTILTPI